jgi:hypothetical protein
MNCKNYIHGLCVNLDYWVEDDDWWEALEPSANVGKDKFYDARPGAAIVVAVTQHCLRECGLSVSILHTVPEKRRKS